MGEQANLFHYMNLHGNLETRTVPFGQIFLDVDNPRLFGEVLRAGATTLEDYTWDSAQAKELLRRALVRNADGQSLMDSIATLGFLPMDRIVVYEREPEKYVVLEGNRRLACMITLLGLHGIKDRVLSEDVLSTFESIEVLVLTSAEEDRDRDIFLLQGVRHLVGVRPWGPYQQAKMVYNCVVEKGMTYKDTSQAIGLSVTRASAMLHAYLGVLQMEQHPTYGSMASPDLFSHFDQAYKQLAVRSWLMWSDCVEDGSRGFVNQAEMEQFYRMITTGNPETGQRAITAQEVRDLLPKVLDDELARESFLSGRLSITAAAEGVPDVVNPSKALRSSTRNVNLALDDLPVEFLCSSEGRHDMKVVKELYQRLEGLMREFAVREIDRKAA